MNIYGLKRELKEDVKRIIRQEAGFGCVICGSGIYDYEHIEPEFKDAKIHDPNCMTLLCPTCHSKVTRGRLSKESVMEAKKNPVTLQQGYSNDWFDFKKDTMPFIQFAGTLTERCQIPLMVGGVPIIEIKPPEVDGTPYLLSGRFFDSNGNCTLEIINNEWRALSTNWDMKYIGQVLTIKNKNKKSILQLRVNPPNGIIIERLDMNVFGNSIVVTPDFIEINTNKFYGGVISGGHIGFSIE